MTPERLEEIRAQGLQTDAAREMIAEIDHLVTALKASQDNGKALVGFLETDRVTHGAALRAMREDRDWHQEEVDTLRARFDFEAHLAHQAEWSESTFGPGKRTAGICEHIRKELLEIEANPDDADEWIDVIILALDGAWRVGLPPHRIIARIIAKQEKNKGRRWPDWRSASPDKAIEHIKCEACAGRGYFSHDMMGSSFYPCKICNSDNRNPVTA